jgi:hypothetical protein
MHYSRSAGDLAVLYKITRLKRLESVMNNTMLFFFFCIEILRQLLYIIKLKFDLI